MKLLFLTPQPPFPPDQGAKLRNANLIRIAAQAGHEADLLTFAPASSDRMKTGEASVAGASEVSPLTQTWVRRATAVPLPAQRSWRTRAQETALSKLPDLLLRLWSPAFLGTLEELLHAERYDVVQAEGLELGLYLRAVHGPRKILDEHNVEYLLQCRAWRSDRRQPRRAHAALYSFIQWRRLRRWEARLCAEADVVLAVSDRDAAALRALSGQVVLAVPNGVDLANTPFREPADQVNPNLLFDGTMSFRPNRDAANWFIRDILPLVRERCPEVRFWVVGRDPPSEVIAFNFGPNAVAVTGAVPSVEPYWERAGLYVLPMRMGGGVRFKALQAMARGLPLVSTALGMEGTSAEPERDFLRAEQPSEFAAAVLRLLEDAALRHRLTAHARRTVTAYDWTRIGPRLVKVYEHMDGRR